MSDLNLETKILRAIPHYLVPNYATRIALARTIARKVGNNLSNDEEISPISSAKMLEMITGHRYPEQEPEQEAEEISREPFHEDTQFQAAE